MKETYGNVPTDSSDDTYGSTLDSSDDRGWDSGTRKRGPKTLVLALSNNGSNDDLTNVKTKRSYKRRTRQKPGAINVNNSVTETPVDTAKSSSSVKKSTSSSNRRLSQPALEVTSPFMFVCIYIFSIGWDFLFHSLSYLSCMFFFLFSPVGLGDKGLLKDLPLVPLHLRMHCDA